MDRVNLEQFYIKWQVNLPQRIEGYIYDENKKILPTRFIFANVKKIIERFLNDELSEIEKSVNWKTGFILMSASFASTKFL